MKAKRTMWVLLPLLIACLDYISKTLVTTFVPLHSTYTAIPDFFNLTISHNCGAIFGFMSKASLPLRAVVFSFTGLVALVYFGRELLKNETLNLQRTAIGFIIGGTIGNSIDRMRYGFVIDFLDFTFYGWHYWTFNVADSFIVCGTVILVLSYLPSTKRTKLT